MSSMVTSNNIKTATIEMYRSLGVNIQFISKENNIKTIVVTSVGPKEGKSTVITNLGVILAEFGNKVLVMDANLRNPTIHNKFRITYDKGLSNILTGGASYNDTLYATNIKNLEVLLCGPIPCNPVALLNCKIMKDLLEKLKVEYDYILIDSPAISVAADASLLSHMCDGTLFVIASDEATIEDTILAKELLISAGANILGAIHNKIEVNKKNRSNKFYKFYEFYSKLRFRK